MAEFRRRSSAARHSSAIQSLIRRHKDGEFTRDELKVAAGAVYDTMSGVAWPEDTEIISSVYNKLASTDETVRNSLIISNHSLIITRPQETFMTDRGIEKARQRRLASKLTHARLLEVLDYDPLTGKFTWKRGHGRRKIGDEAGFETCNYILISVDGEKFQAHHLAWFFMKGVWSDGLLDHESGDSLDNTWTNIREATRAQNNANSRAKSHNASGLKGVQARANGRFGAYAQQAHGRRKYLGMFDTAKEAHEAHLIASKAYYGAFARQA